MAQTPNQMPRLSEELAGPRFPERCQACGGEAAEMWQECDTDDRPEPVLVLLCIACSKKIIEPHPRLYKLLPQNQPWPGALALCAGCNHRDGLACRHPDLKANGGLGLEIIHPKPAAAHVRYSQRQKNGLRGAWLTFYPGPARWCAGKDPQDPQQPDKPGRDPREENPR